MRKTYIIRLNDEERGTTEAMLATPVRSIDMMLGKLLTCYLLGICSTAICVLFGVLILGVPFRSSVFALFLVSSAFLLRMITYLFPGRYYVTSLQTLFMAGDVWMLLLPNMAYTVIIGLVFMVLTFLKTSKRLA